MNKYILTLLALLMASTITLGQKSTNRGWPPTTEWYSVSHITYPFKWQWNSSGPNNEIIIPYAPDITANKVMWVNQILTRKVQGNIIGKTISITLEIDAPSSWAHWGEWGNNAGNRRDVRIFLLGYDDVYAASWITSVYAIEDYTQWCKTSAPLVQNYVGKQLITLTTVAHFSNFSNSVGQSTLAGFERCAIDVNQIGVALSGGRYYSVGVCGREAENRIKVVSFSVY